MARDLQQEVTDKIIAALETAQSWQRPWISGIASGMPMNATTKRRYRGINVPMLFLAQTAGQYESAAWASYKQWAERGAQVRKGEHGTMIVYYGSLQPRDENGAVDGDGKVVRFLKCSTVFNSAQVDGWQAPVVELPTLAERIEAAESYIANTLATVLHRGDMAFFSRARDEIHMPALQCFKPGRTGTASESYYGTLLHELVHWTGVESRCNRDLKGRFGDEHYAAEELVAEMGAAYLCASLGISAEPRADHADYIATWTKAIKSDKRAIFTAAARASDAHDYLDKFQPAATAESEPEALAA